MADEIILSDYNGPTCSGPIHLSEKTIPMLKSQPRRHIDLTKYTLPVPNTDGLMKDFKEGDYPNHPRMAYPPAPAPPHPSGNRAHPSNTTSTREQIKAKVALYKQKRAEANAAFKAGNKVQVEEASSSAGLKITADSSDN